ncbi:hypothetical protein ACV229_21660 [Burkholderia sp. MR1-5-21]
MLQRDIGWIRLETGVPTGWYRAISAAHHHLILHDDRDVPAPLVAVQCVPVPSS